MRRRLQQQLASVYSLQQAEQLSHSKKALLPDAWFESGIEFPRLARPCLWAEQDAIERRCSESEQRELIFLG